MLPASEEADLIERARDQMDRLERLAERLAAAVRHQGGNVLAVEGDRSPQRADEPAA